MPSLNDDDLNESPDKFDWDYTADEDVLLQAVIDAFDKGGRENFADVLRVVKRAYRIKTSDLVGSDNMIGARVTYVDGDGEPEVVVTVADADDGARIAVHDATGSHLATGPVYGSGWRHQLCVAPFPPDGRPELAVTRKPHVDRVVEFYRFADGALTVEAEVPDVSTHTYGSYNVDGGLAADLDADGRPELLVPNARRDELLAIRRTAGGAAVAWRRALGGTLRTNLAGVALPDGGVAVGAGTAAGVRVWQG